MFVLPNLSVCEMYDFQCDIIDSYEVDFIEIQNTENVTFTGLHIPHFTDCLHEQLTPFADFREINFI